MPTETNESVMTPEEIEYWFQTDIPSIQKMHEQMLNDGYSREYIAEMERYFG